MDADIGFHTYDLLAYACKHVQIVDSLPIATPTLLGVMYGALPVSGYNSSLSLGYGAPKRLVLGALQLATTY